MGQHIGNITLVVRDYDEAIAFYTQKLQFTVVEDTILSDQKRWVLIAPKESAGVRLLLAKATNEEQQTRIGNQTGGRVFLFLFTDTFEKDYKNLIANQITVVREPIKEEYGTVCVFEDLYGNLWDLIGE
jgi:catechol 2,3-dioxygenase-like lactoylglutathione lyase family enzyme